MIKPKHYEQAEIFTGGNYIKLPPGGYVCKIINTKIETISSGAEMLVIAFDIAGNSEYKDFYKKEFNQKKINFPNAKWGGTYRQLLPGVDAPADDIKMRLLKSNISAIEQSNPNFKFDFNEKTLVNKLFGGVFGEEEWEYNNKNGVRTSLRYINPIDGIEKIEIPPLKELKTKNTSSQQQNMQATQEDISSLIDDDLPF